MYGNNLIRIALFGDELTRHLLGIGLYKPVSRNLDDYTISPI
jgi:hypothetical protein